MSRIAQAVLSTSQGFAKGTTQVMLDPRYGGQMGYQPNMEEWVSNQPYVPRNIVCVLLQAPKGFNYLPNPDLWIGTLKALVELHKIRITGLQMGLTVDVTETPVGGAGQMHEEPTDVKEARSAVSFSWNEKYGMPVFNFLNAWIRNLIMDPNSKVAAINTIAGVKIPDMLADMRGATIAFYEPDPTHTRVIKGWIGTNMFPKETGENVGQFDLSSAQDKKDLDIPFAGIFQTGLGVNAFCQRLLDGINITNANPYQRESFIKDMSADVKSIGNGYASEIEKAARGSIKV